MNKYLEIVGHVAAIVGIGLCVLSALLRVLGFFYVLGFEAVTIFNAGVGLMVMACLAKLHVMNPRE